ncbi:MAG: hypothetical protein PHW19_05375 [Salinivirgaceae bacterium]|nr:hypothetical protein [Salinivirgaceae bacterium]
MNEEPIISATNQAEVTCPSCAGNLLYSPGTKSLKCEHCGTIVEIDDSPLTVEELDFEEYLSKVSDDIETQEIITAQCTSCGAHVNFEPNIVSDRCPFCSSILVITEPEKETQIKPGSVLPFAITRDDAFGQFRKWIKKLWFAPNDLTKKVTNSDSLNGVYVPFWTYDAETYTQWRGRRGDNYYETETYTTTENGKPVTKTRTVTKIRWTSVSGDFNRFFDDVLVLASQSLPKKYADELEPWDLENLESYNERYLSGYRTETYQVNLKTGYDEAKAIMKRELSADVRSRIGGDHQQITEQVTEHSDIKFKHILLPIYISAFNYGKKVYRFLVNARTGEVQGERPYSVWKIVFACLGVVAIGVLGYFIYNYYY